MPGGADGGAGPGGDGEKKKIPKEPKEKKAKTVEQQAKTVVRMHYAQTPKPKLLNP